MAGKIPVLIMIQGHEPGSRWELQETRVSTIGRSSRNQIVLVSPSVSRFHCEISHINGLWYVADLNGKKGAFLNGQRITAQEVLKPGDVIRLGRNVLKFDLVDQEEEQEAAIQAISEAAGTQVLPVEEDRFAPAARGQEASLPLTFYLSKFLGVIITAVAVLVTVSGALAYGHYLAGKMRHEQEQRAEAAEEDVAAAAALVEAGPARYREALEALAKVVRTYPGHPAARRAATMYAEEEGKWLDREMERITASEATGDYRDALERSSSLLEGILNSELRALVQERQQFSVRLARAAYERVDLAAQRLSEEGRREEAVRLYQETIPKIGVPELIRDAEEKIRQLQGQLAGPEEPAGEPPAQPETGPAPEPLAEPEATEGLESRPPAKLRDTGDVPSEKELHERTTPILRLL